MKLNFADKIMEYSMKALALVIAAIVITVGTALNSYAEETNIEEFLKQYYEEHGYPEPKDSGITFMGKPEYEIVDSGGGMLIIKTPSGRIVQCLNLDGQNVMCYTGGENHWCMMIDDKQLACPGLTIE